MKRAWRFCVVLAAVALCPLAATAQQVAVQELVLDNGMKVLMVPRKGDPNVAAGWVAKVGSVNERPGITGISHLFEHMMFKGTRTIGTTNIDEDLEAAGRDGRREGQAARRGAARWPTSCGWARSPTRATRSRGRPNAPGAARRTGRASRRRSAT